MSRCRSWRPAATPHTPAHLPGQQCTTCWRPCFSKVPKGTQVCDDCVAVFAEHPNSAIRLALVESGSAEESTLRALTEDLDAMVAYAAQWQLDHRLSARAGTPRATEPLPTPTPTVPAVAAPPAAPSHDPWAGWTDGS